MSQKERRIHVLKAIVVEHVATRGPVSSKTVARDHVGGVSSATIRSDMSALEAEGLIHQPHVSAGRVPTDAGYRQFVDHLDVPTKRRDVVRADIRSALAKAPNAEETVVKAVRLLTQLTGQAAIAEFPDLSLAGVKRIQVIDLLPPRFMVLVVSTSGRVAERNFQLDQSDLDDEDLQVVSKALTNAAADKTVHEIRQALRTAGANLPAHLQPVTRAAAQAVREILKPLGVAKVVSGGGANLVKDADALTDPAALLAALEDQEDLIGALTSLHVRPVDVSIGEEHQSPSLAEASLVSATYAVPETDTVHVGVIGPTRMDYPLSLAATKAVAECLSELLLAGAKDSQSAWLGQEEDR